MKINNWLTVKNNGSCRLTKSKPGVDCNEVSIQLEINLPDALFAKPRLEAKITVPDEAAATEIIESVVSDNVQDAIEQATGLTFSISVVKEDDKE